MAHLEMQVGVCLAFTLENGCFFMRFYLMECSNRIGKMVEGCLF